MIQQKLFYLLLCVGLLIPTQAQKFKGGMQLGILATQVDGDNRGNYNKPGLFVGAFTAFPFANENMSIQLEIDYAQKGSKSKGKLPDGRLNKSRLALHQIEVPVLYNWKFIPSFSLTGGTSFNMIVHYKKYNLNGEPYPELTTAYDLRFFELGMLLGLNYYINDNIGLSFRYGYSLTPLGPSLYRRIGLRNNFLQFHLSYTM